jgi:hypothetical protein
VCSFADFFASIDISISQRAAKSNKSVKGFEDAGEAKKPASRKAATRKRQWPDMETPVFRSTSEPAPAEIAKCKHDLAGLTPKGSFVAA